MARMKYTKPKVKPFSPNVRVLLAHENSPDYRGRSSSSDDYQERCLALVRQIIAKRTKESELKRRDRESAARERERQVRLEQREARRRQKRVLAKRDKQERRKGREQKGQSEQQRERVQEHVEPLANDHDEEIWEEEEEGEEEGKEEGEGDEEEQLHRSQRMQEPTKQRRPSRQPPSSTFSSQDKRNDREDSGYWPDDPDSLTVRFGTTKFYENTFNNIEYIDARQTYQMLDFAKSGSHEDYETVRQKFLKILGQHKGAWHSTGPEDKGLELSKIYRADDGREYLAFMRISPGGYRSEKTVPELMEFAFHLILGKACFTNRKRNKQMSRGSHVTLSANTPFSIRTIGSDQAAYFVLSIKRLQPNGK